MNQELSPFLCNLVMGYLDDIIIFSESVEEHAEHIEQLFRAFQGAELNLKSEQMLLWQDISGSSRLCYFQGWHHCSNREDLCYWQSPCSLECHGTMFFPWHGWIL